MARSPDKIWAAARALGLFAGQRCEGPVMPLQAFIHASAGQFNFTRLAWIGGQAPCSLPAAVINSAGMPGNVAHLPGALDMTQPQG